MKKLLIVLSLVVFASCATSNLTPEERAQRRAIFQRMAASQDSAQYRSRPFQQQRPTQTECHANSYGNSWSCSSQQTGIDTSIYNNGY